MQVAQPFVLGLPLALCQGTAVVTTAAPSAAAETTATRGGLLPDGIRSSAASSPRRATSDRGCATSPAAPRRGPPRRPADHPRCGTRFAPRGGEVEPHELLGAVAGRQMVGGVLAGTRLDHAQGARHVLQGGRHRGGVLATGLVAVGHDDHVRAARAPRCTRAATCRRRLRCRSPHSRRARAPRRPSRPRRCRSPRDSARPRSLPGAGTARAARRRASTPTPEPLGRLWRNDLGSKRTT